MSAHPADVAARQHAAKVNRWMALENKAVPAFDKLVLRLLAQCHSSSGCVTGDFTPLMGRQPGRESNRQHSAYVAGLLLGMEKRGLIIRADENKPILWRLPAQPKAMP